MPERARAAAEGERDAARHDAVAALERTRSEVATLKGLHKREVDALRQQLQRAQVDLLLRQQQRAQGSVAQTPPRRSIQGAEITPPPVERPRAGGIELSVAKRPPPLPPLLRAGL